MALGLDREGLRCNRELMAGRLPFLAAFGGPGVGAALPALGKLLCFRPARGPEGQAFGAARCDQGLTGSPKKKDKLVKKGN